MTFNLLLQHFLLPLKLQSLCHKKVLDKSFLCATLMAQLLQESEMNEDELKIIDNLVTANLLVTTTKDAVAEAKHAHREAIKKAALAKAAYEELLLKRLEACNAAQ